MLLENLRALLRALKGLQSRLPRGDRRVLREDLKTDAKAIVDSYFRDVQQHVGGAASEALAECDKAMQELLALTNRQGSAMKYRTALTSLKKHLAAVEALAVAGSATPVQRFETVDQKILNVLRGLLPGAARSYEQAINDLEGGDRLSWRGPATDLREALRETLDQLAPDDAVKADPEFKIEPDTKGPTMRQKVRHVLRNRDMSDAAKDPAEKAADAVDEIVGKFVRSVYTRSNVSTHTPTSRNEVTRVREFVRVALCELLEVR